MDALDTFIEGLYLEEDEEGTTVSPKDWVTDLSNLVGTPIRLSASQQRDMIDDPDSIVEDVRSQIELALYNRYLNRLVGAVERRINETVSIDMQEINSGSWSGITSQIIASIEGIYKSRQERYVGRGSAAEASGEEGQITREVKNILADVRDRISIQQFYQLLLRMPQGTQATFDKKTHRRVMLKKTRLNYLYYASGLIDLSDPEQLTAGILSHLQVALITLQRTWGIIELSQRSELVVSDLDQPLKAALQTEFAGDISRDIEATKIINLSGSAKQFLVEEYGRRALTEIYRQLLLSVITELWVDYLTQMEGLRVSVGLEAYAQRDPLVQYKKRAFELYQELLSNVRMSVVTRMFKYRPQAASQPVEQPTRKEVLEEVQLETEQLVEERALEPERVRQPAAAEKPRKSLSTSQKRRRKRRKRK
jgi:preprotein translocase subunit SecA